MPAPIVAALAKPFAIPALTVLAELIPTIGKLFNGESPSRVAERNLGAVEAIADKVLPLVVQATGAPNVQAAVEAVQANPAVAREVDEALYRQRAEFEHLAVKEARAFNERLAREGVAFWQMPAFWISVALLVPLYAVIGTVLWHSGWMAEKELRTQTVTAVLGIIGLVGAFWLGTSFGSYLKDRQREREATAGGR